MPESCVAILDVVLLADSTHMALQLAEVVSRHTWEQMVLQLELEASVEPAIQGTTLDVARCDRLLLKERVHLLCAVLGGSLIVTQSKLEMEESNENVVEHNNHQSILRWKHVGHGGIPGEEENDAYTLRSDPSS